MKDKHHLSKKKRFTLLLIPESEGAKTYSKSFTQLSLILSIIGIFIVIGSLTVVIFAYTPLGRFFPVPNALIEQKYGNELSDLEKKLIDLTNDFIIVQDYNLKLRNALGEDSTRHNFISNLEEDQNFENSISKEETKPQVKNFYSVNYNFIKPKLPFSSPAGGILTREFNSAQQHFGIDFSGKIGNIISATADGVVVFAGWSYEYGNTIILNHGDGFSSVYKHNHALLKNVNQKVRRGESIALLGETGTTSSGAHLHFEVWKDGVAIDPTKIIFTDRKF